MFAVVESASEFFSYGAVLFFFLASIGLTVGMIAANRILGAKSNPNPDKIESYECGEAPIGSAWLRFNIRFYMVALVFVVFDVELALVFPIAALFKDTVNTTMHPGQMFNPTAFLVAVELLVFVGVLFLGLIYIWKKNDLGWNRVYRENADVEELVQQRLAHLPPVKIRPRSMPAPAPKPVVKAAPVAAAAPTAASAAKPGVPAALAAKLAAAKAAAGGGAAAVPAAAKPGIPAALAAKLAAAKAAAGGGAAPAAPASAAEAKPAGGIPPALAAKLAAAKAKAAEQGKAPTDPPATGGNT